jgi:hypothetical protein
MNAEVAVVRPRVELSEAAWTDAKDPIAIGKDVLELLSSSMYVDAMSIFREYVQNAADAINQRSRHMRTKSAGRIQIRIDPNERQIVLRDNGTGIHVSDFTARLISLGASTQRGTAARGFRGVGRLAGLGYCQELIFHETVERGKVGGEKKCHRNRHRARYIPETVVVSALGFSGGKHNKMSGRDDRI